MIFYAVWKFTMLSGVGLLWQRCQFPLQVWKSRLKCLRLHSPIKYKKYLMTTTRFCSLVSQLAKLQGSGISYILYLNFQISQPKHIWNCYISAVMPGLSCPLNITYTGQMKVILRRIFKEYLGNWIKFVKWQSLQASLSMTYDEEQNRKLRIMDHSHSH